jgi:hypothetical protein
MPRISAVSVMRSVSLREGARAGSDLYLDTFVFVMFGALSRRMIIEGY